MIKFISKPLEEQETVINFDYYSKILNIYTTRVATMKRLIKVLGEANNIGQENEKVDWMEWELDFSKRGLIKKALSLLILLPFNS